MAKYVFTIFLVTAFLISCNNTTETNTGDANPQWHYLFNGENTEQWRSYNADTFPSGWFIEDETLVVNKGGGDLITKEKFTNFELELDFLMTDTSNSGIFYRVVEVDTSPIWHNAPEYQLLDNDYYENQLGKDWMQTHYTAENYDLYSAPADYSNPIGEWNSARIICNNGRVEHWLNNNLAIKYNFLSDEWHELVAESKFKDYPLYGQVKTGHIGLQDHNYTVKFRNIRIRELE